MAYSRFGVAILFQRDLGRRGDKAGAKIFRRASVRKSTLCLSHPSDSFAPPECDRDYSKKTAQGPRILRGLGLSAPAPAENASMNHIRQIVPRHLGLSAEAD